ncbi:MAG: hypothetical protein HOW73_30270 [Polyangiaceae bacterium]|nr:hypothetical protein [Polyangiaceae bacterium]
MLHLRVAPTILGGAACFAVLLLTGCQLVFGIDGYESDAPATGGGGAGGTASEGGGGSGGAPVEGGGGSGGAPCVCEGIWRPATLEARGPGDSALPTLCGDGSAPTVVFVGPPTVSCTACGCAADGCEPPGLLCYPEDSCGGTGVLTDPGPGGCSDLPGSGCRSYRLAGDVPPATCTPNGGEAMVSAPSFEEFLAFCADPGCAPGCATDTTECVVADGVAASDCPAGFDQRYVFDDGGEAACEPCECTASCNGPAYEAGIVFTCESESIDGTSCTSPGYTTTFAHAKKTAGCSVTDHDQAYPGAFVVDGHHTVCCRNPIDGLTPR